MKCSRHPRRDLRVLLPPAGKPVAAEGLWGCGNGHRPLAPARAAGEADAPGHRRVTFSALVMRWVATQTNY
jgi:hypothetical protein